MIEEILLVHHSHTDIGYTHPQPVVLELHRRFIDQALDFADETAAWDEACRFKWTCEVTGVTLDWWRRSDDRQRARFLEAVARGQLEVAGFRWNMTPLMDHRMLLDLLAPVREFRSLGVPVRSAMNCDVNGLPWGTVDALLDHGIGGLSMAINEHFGYAPQPRPAGFRWEAPSGRTLLVYNGLHYGISPDYLLKVPVDHDQATAAVPAYCRTLEERGYPHRVVMMQVTNPHLYDNASPRLALPEFVRAWNRAGHPIRLRTATLSDLFDALRADPAESLPTRRGDWSDWWNFGAGSTANETARALAGQRALHDADGLRAWPGRENALGAARYDALRADAADDLALYAEHTWGANRSVQKHRSPETRLQLHQKLVTADRGYSVARMLRRDGLEHLARHAGGRDLSVLVYNPLPFPVRRSVRVPAAADAFLEALAAPEPHMVHHQDVVFGDLAQADATPWQVETPAWRWAGPIEMPALGYASTAFADLARPKGAVSSDDAGLSDGRMRVEFDARRGGVRSLVLDGTEVVAERGWPCGVPVLERPASGGRGELFGPPRWDPPDRVHDLWHVDWQAEREAAALLESGAVVEEGCGAYRQTFELGGDRVTITYRRFPGEAGLDLEVTLDKAATASPHAVYLPLPLALDGAARCHYETAGAVVELDREQLPNAARHYLTTGRFIRLQDDARGVSVACPDTPLWQVGGFTFGRHRQGEVERGEATLVAWLTNNYWDTNFQADQSGTTTFRFRIVPHPAQPLAASLRALLPFVQEPQVHLYRDRGERRHHTAGLLELEHDGLLLTGVEHDGRAVRLHLLNPEDRPLDLVVAPGVLTPEAARWADLAGNPGSALACEEGRVRATVGARAWTGLQLEVSW